MNERNKITHPVFIISLLLLIINDWYFKAAFHNEITGKLSDFAGLFAFPFLFSVLFPKYKTSIHICTGLLFIFWNSEFSQFIINHLNEIGLPIARTVDMTDNVALLALIVSYQCLNYQIDYQLNPFLRQTLIIVSFLAFAATSMPPRHSRKFVDINKKYQFNFPKSELVSKFNMVQLESVQRTNKSRHRQINFNAETNTFYLSSHQDTFAVMLDYKQIQDQDTIELRYGFAEIMITGNHSKSQIKLLSLRSTFPGIRPDDVDEIPHREKTIKEFEKQIIKKIKKYKKKY